MPRRGGGGGGGDGGGGGGGSKRPDSAPAAQPAPATATRPSNTVVNAGKPRTLTMPLEENGGKGEGWGETRVAVCLICKGNFGSCRISLIAWPSTERWGIGFIGLFCTYNRSLLRQRGGVLGAWRSGELGW
jgi:hypothetical protein